jgi:hypothetical protein
MLNSFYTLSSTVLSAVQSNFSPTTTLLFHVLTLLLSIVLPTSLLLPHRVAVTTTASAGGTAAAATTATAPATDSTADNATTTATTATVAAAVGSTPLQLPAPVPQADPPLNIVRIIADVNTDISGGDSPRSFLQKNGLTDKIELALAAIRGQVVVENPNAAPVKRGRPPRKKEDVSSVYC